MTMCVQAALLGGNARVGLEDSLTIGPGKLAVSNAEQVAKLRRILEELSLPIATPDEARARLALKGADQGTLLREPDAMTNMYADNDPRSRLGYGGGTSSRAGAASPPPNTHGSTRASRRRPAPACAPGTARGQNFIVAVSETEPGAVLERTGQVDEYVAILQERGKGAKIDANGERTSVQGHSIVILPPGDKPHRAAQRRGAWCACSPTRSKDLAAKCSNADAYAERHPLHPAIGVLARPAGRLPRARLQPRRAAQGRALRPDLALHHLHGQRVRAGGAQGR